VNSTATDCLARLAVIAAATSVALACTGAPAWAQRAGPAVGAQYDSTHVYLAHADYDAFVAAIIATFGGKASGRITANVTPVPASTEAQYIWTPVGTISTFAFQTPIPFPFGEERTGWLVSDIDQALSAARKAGAEVIVAKFKDPIGYDAIIQWPGGVKMQLYWHFTAPSYPALDTIPDNRVYVSADSVDSFVRDFLKFSHGRIVADDRRADGGEIGRPGESYRRLRLESGFGRMQVMVTDGHLPYPFGHEVTGYAVSDLDATLAKATAAGATVLSPRFDARDRSNAVVQFPGGFIAEIHAPRARP
jgi:predicted enzyme related to lactoylglutathione lyase